MNKTDVGFAFVGTNQATRMKNCMFAFVCVHIQTYKKQTYSLCFYMLYIHTHIHIREYIYLIEGLT